MDQGLILETTFLVDLQRELVRARPGPAQAFLEAYQAEPLSITFTIAGELAAGFSPGGRSAWAEFVAPFEVLPCTADVCWEYGQAWRYLKTNGLSIGANDLWIAAAAVAFAKPLVTRNFAEFRRVPRIEALGY